MNCVDFSLCCVLTLTSDVDDGVNVGTGFFCSRTILLGGIYLLCSECLDFWRSEIFLR